MKALLLAGVVGIISLMAPAPSQVNAAERQSNNDTVAVRWHGGHYHAWRGARYYGNNYWRGSYYYPSYGYGSYYYPSYGYSNYYYPSYGYSSYYYPSYGYYRPGFGLYLGL